MKILIVIALLAPLSAAFQFRDFYIKNKNFVDERTLHQAVIEGNIADVRKCVHYGVDVNHKNRSGDTPLHEAVDYADKIIYAGHKKIAQYLIDHGADIDSRACALRTPLYKAAFNGQKNMVNLLIREHADVNIPNNIGWTPLFAAARFGNEKIVEELIRYGAKVDIKDVMGRTLLEIAEKSVNQNIIKMIQAETRTTTKSAPCFLKEIDKNTWICYDQ